VQGVEHLQEINQASLVDFEAEVFEGNAPVAERQNLLKEMPADARKRLIRGHQVLGEQLKVLDQDKFRATKAVLAVDLKQDNVSELLEPTTKDDKYWAALVTLLTMALLFRGRYGMIQNISLVLVVSFTFITIGNVLSLQASKPFHISPDQFMKGLSFGLPRAIGDINPLLTALAAFGIIGVGASELITYPYWCLEKGYAKFTGKRSDDDAWANRARGWMRVMHVDAFLSMIVYTVATLAFFLMGVAVLYNEGRDPDGMRMVSTLATAYVPVFGEYARWLFMIGAVAVLYSTFLVATAGNARMWTDGLKIYGFMDHNNEKSHDRGITFFSLLIPVLCLVSFWGGVNPVSAVLVAGFMQATMLPMIGFGALYLRHTRTDPRLKPSKAWDAALIISCIGLLMAGVWGAVQQIQKALG
jgi:Mn2+/Fe2+ NRAMP family transporter